MPSTRLAKNNLREQFQNATDQSKRIEAEIDDLRREEHALWTDQLQHYKKCYKYFTEESYDLCSLFVMLRFSKIVIETAVEDAERLAKAMPDMDIKKSVMVKNIANVRAGLAKGIAFRQSSCIAIGNSACYSN